MSDLKSGENSIFIKHVRVTDPCARSNTQNILKEFPLLIPYLILLKKIPDRRSSDLTTASSLTLSVSFCLPEQILIKGIQVCSSPTGYLKSH